MLATIMIYRMNTVLCPSCGKEVEISQALRHQIEDQVLKSAELKHKGELESLRKEVEEKAFFKAKEDLALKLRTSEDEANEAKEAKRKLQAELLAITKEKRQLQEKDDQRELEMQKRLVEERSKLQNEISKSEKEKAEIEKNDLKKQLDDTKKLLEDARRKADQKSQQLQGEVLELEFEEIIRKAFPDDEIIPIAKGQKGADIQIDVRSKRGNNCGRILVEVKRHKNWDEDWITKLKGDVRSSGAVIGLVVSSILPKDEASEFNFRNGVYIAKPNHVIPLLETLRKGIIDVAYQKFISANQSDKAAALYQYITGHEFRQQIESIIEVYTEQIVQVTKERAAFEKIWKAREAQAQKLMMGVAGIYGTLQGKSNNSLPQIKSLELSAGEDLTEESAQPSLLK